MSNTNTRTTRSGRSVKPPERWFPQEECIDDFKPDEYDSDAESDVSSTLSISDEEEDGDEDLEGFIVDDEGDDVEYCGTKEDEEDDVEYCESDESE